MKIWRSLRLSTYYREMLYELRGYWTKDKWWEVGSGEVNFGPIVGFVLRQTACRQVSIIPDTSRGFIPHWPLEIFIWLVLSVSFHYSSPAFWPFLCSTRDGKLAVKWNQEQPMKVNVFPYFVQLLFPLRLHISFFSIASFLNKEWDLENEKWNLPQVSHCDY